MSCQCFENCCRPERRSRRFGLARSVMALAGSDPSNSTPAGCVRVCAHPRRSSGKRRSSRDFDHLLWQSLCSTPAGRILAARARLSQHLLKQLPARSLLLPACALVFSSAATVRPAQAPIVTQANEKRPKLVSKYLLRKDDEHFEPSQSPRARTPAKDQGPGRLTRPGVFPHRPPPLRRGGRASEAASGSLSSTLTKGV